AGTSLHNYWASRRGTAAGLRQLNSAFAGEFFKVPPEATQDLEAADESLGGGELVIDVQTHYMAPSKPLFDSAPYQMSLYKEWGPEWMKGLEGVDFYGFDLYLRSIFLQSETAVAVLTAPPPNSAGTHYLTNAQLSGTRELIDRFTATGRLLNHTVI